MAGIHYNEGNLSTSSGLVPPGVIAVWSGAVTDIPAGWALCNGSNGTPDLRDRFVIGAGSTYAVGATGGSAQVSHSHSFSINTSSVNTGSNSATQESQARITLSGSHYHTISGTSSSQSLENRPPFYALAFIMKL